MKLQLRYIIGGGAKLLLPLLLINSAFADSTSDARIQAYKANKLLSSEIVLPTTTNAEDSQEVVFFNSSGLIWNKDTAGVAKQVISAGIYGDWSATDFQSAFDAYGDYGFEGCYGWEQYPNYWLTPDEEVDKHRDMLNKIANGEITLPNITAQEAANILQKQIEDIGIAYMSSCGCCSFSYGNFNMNGLTLTGELVPYADVSGCTAVGTDFTGINNLDLIKISQFKDIEGMKITGTQLGSGETYLKQTHAGKTIYIDGVGPYVIPEPSGGSGFDGQ